MVKFDTCKRFKGHEHPQILRPKNLESVAMATVVASYPPKPNQLYILLR